MEINHVTLDDIEYPEVLYKYRSWSNKYNKRFITEREVFMASPDQFEDKVDCKIPVRYELMSVSQAKRFYNRLVQDAEPDFSRAQRRRKVSELVKKREYLDNQLIQNYREQYFTELFEKLGVLSLTAENCLDDMWKKYADDHKGFCVGYNSSVLFEHLGGGGIVNYVDELPILFPDPLMDRKEMIRKQVYSKESKWSFEKEYRTEKFWVNGASLSDRQIQLPKEAFNCIILGKEISDVDRKEIIENVRLHIGNIDIIEYNDVCK